MKIFNQDPNEKLNYRQVVNGDTINSAVWSISPSGPTLDQQVNTAVATTIRVSGIQENYRYTLLCHVVGVSGQEWERSCVIKGVNV